MKKQTLVLNNKMKDLMVLLGASNLVYALESRVTKKGNIKAVLIEEIGNETIKLPKKHLISEVLANIIEAGYELTNDTFIFVLLGKIFDMEIETLHSQKEFDDGFSISISDNIHALIKNLLGIKIKKCGEGYSIYEDSDGIYLHTNLFTIENIDNLDSFMKSKLGKNISDDAIFKIYTEKNITLFIRHEDLTEVTDENDDFKTVNEELCFNVVNTSCSLESLFKDFINKNDDKCGFITCSLDADELEEFVDKHTSDPEFKDGEFAIGTFTDKNKLKDMADKFSDGIYPLEVLYLDGPDCILTKDELTGFIKDLFNKSSIRKVIHNFPLV